MNVDIISLSNLLDDSCQKLPETAFELTRIFVLVIYENKKDKGGVNWISSLQCNFLKKSSENHSSYDRKRMRNKILYFDQLIILIDYFLNFCVFSLQY